MNNTRRSLLTLLGLSPLSFFAKKAYATEQPNNPNNLPVLQEETDVHEIFSNSLWKPVDFSTATGKGHIRGAEITAYEPTVSNYEMRECFVWLPEHLKTGYHGQLSEFWGEIKISQVRKFWPGGKGEYTYECISVSRTENSIQRGPIPIKWLRQLEGV